MTNLSSVSSILVEGNVVQVKQFCFAITYPVLCLLYIKYE